MKNVWLFFALIILCGCSADNDFFDNMDQNIATRSSDGTTDYCFNFYYTPNAKSYDYIGGTKEFTINSYMETDGIVTDLEPEIISKPAWVDSIGCMHVYYKIYVLFVRASENNTNSERSGTLIIGQPNSSKRLSIPLRQEHSTNMVNINITSPFANRYVFTARTNYPVKEEVVILVPFDVFNDGGKMTQNAGITIPKNETTGSCIMEFNGSPLVYYHGNLKGYKLYEGIISSKREDIFTYNFVQYW